MVLHKVQIGKKVAADGPVNTDAELPGWFVYLMIQLGRRCKNEANLKVARDVFEDARKHNTGETNDKATKPARGSWQVEMSVGPFSSQYRAEEFRKLWMQKSRGPISRRARGVELVAHYQEEGLALSTEMREREQAEWSNIFCFDKRIVPRDLNVWLAERGMDYLTQPDERLAKLYAHHVESEEVIVSCEPVIVQWRRKVAAAAMAERGSASSLNSGIGSSSSSSSIKSENRHLAD